MKLKKKATIAQMNTHRGCLQKDLPGCFHIIKQYEDVIQEGQEEDSLMFEGGMG
jgi:hypothetical protein